MYFEMSLKRPHPDSDCDNYSEKSLCSSPVEEGSGHGMTRKRRRGIIEKRRRDRINHSLSELRRLVPTASEKQGSAKLEKAEILQMAVDHLKMLHAKGAMSFDPQRVAMDYHNVGFRECMAEVSRYLVTVEGLDLQDPLRLRMMSHLQHYTAQRELAQRQSQWFPQTYPTPGTSSMSSYQLPPLPSEQNFIPPMPNEDQINANFGVQTSARVFCAQIPPVHPQNAVSAAVQYPYPNANTAIGTGFGQYQPSTSSSSQPKPYRPWGAELAY
ncbi:hairy/enhancer-of-split related with YRPW motif protein-like [Artemia franciscana]|uniref:Hairy/enhancer-of-split related with YRPW motif protein n=1 Tax=Artemia franciscana TaxID=6661 RepID=A0AA88HA46_ARTSF|nr:hypothetical protein QYM36_013959 [Artemia franciscana]